MNAESERHGGDDLPDQVRVPVDLVPIVGRAGRSWSEKEAEKVFDWIKEENGQVFQRMLGLVRGTLEEVKSDSDSTEALKKALDKESRDWLLKFHTKLPDLARSFALTQSASFLTHLWGRYRSFLGVDLPEKVRGILSKTKPDRTGEDIDFVIQWIAESWQDQLLRVARVRLGWSAGSEDAKDAVQDFFKGGVRWVVNNFDAAESPFWPYLSFCFVRFCWRKQKGINKTRQLEQPMPTVVGPDGGTMEIDPPDPNAIQPGKALEREEDLEGWRKAIIQCWEKLPRGSQEAFALRYLSDDRTYISDDEHAIKEIAQSLAIREGAAKVRLHRALLELRECLTRKGHKP